MSVRDSDGRLPFYLCMGIVFGILGFLRGFKIRSQKKLIENIPTSTVRGMAVGLVEVQGKAAIFQKPLCSHFAKAESVFYHYKVEEYRSSGKNGHWVTIAEYTSSESFYLEDETGKVLVSPSGAEFHLAPDRRFTMGFGARDKDAFLNGLSELGINGQGFLGFEKNLRCAETYIAPGDRLYVMGTACPDLGDASSAQGCDHLCIRNEGNAFFCVSDKSEKELLESLGWKMYFYLYGGPALTVTCLFILISYYFQRSF